MAAGDSHALAIFYDRYSSLVYATCVRIIGNRTDASDVLVDVFFELWQRAGSYETLRANPLTFILIIARSRSIDRKRILMRSNLRFAHEDEVNHHADTRMNPLTCVVISEKVRIVREALASLDPIQQQVLEYAYYDSLSHSEIADVLNKPLGTIKTHICQGLIRLRKLLRHWDENPAMASVDKFRKGSADFPIYGDVIVSLCKLGH